MLSNPNPNPLSLISRDSCLVDLNKSFQMEFSDQSLLTPKKKSSIRRSFRSFLEKSFRPKLSISKNSSTATNDVYNNSNINSIDYADKKNFKRKVSINSYDLFNQKFLQSTKLGNASVCGTVSTINAIECSSDYGPTLPKSLFTKWKFVTAIKTLENNSMRCLNFVEGRNFFLLEEEDHDWLVVKDTQSNQVGRVPSQYFIFSYKYHEHSIWFHSDMTRNDAENLFKNEIAPGIFLVRKSESCPDQLSLSVLNRFHDVRHYKIKMINEHSNNQGFYIHQSKLFLNLVDLINHYSTYNDGICCRLSPLLTQSFIDSRYMTNQHTQSDDANQHFNAPTFSCDDVVLKSKLGSGNFGDVWLGVVPKQQRVFAVKIIHQASSKSVNHFKNEIDILSKLDHPKIIKYYTSVVDCDQNRYWIVTNLMKGGNLMEYLRNQTNRAHIKFPELMAIVSQICSGMLYLEDNSIIHRDLAARNILVAESWEAVRICDFGMACTVDSILKNNQPHKNNDDNKSIENSEPTNSDNCSNSNDDHSLFALKWMSPEAAIHKEFSLKSDIWSFGILLYEIVTYGQHPYIGMSNKETVERVVNGYRLPQPAFCPNSIYNVMLSCWSQNPLIRPNFECLLNYFNKVTLVLKYHYLNK